MPDSVFDDEGNGLFLAACQVVKENQAAGRMVATAESCTGGMVATALTDAPGSSAVFECGFVTYSNTAKTAMLGVPETLLADHGAVSTQCTEAMARGVLERTGADVAVSISGVAGPGGGSEEKPVGHVVFGRARRRDGGIEARSTIRRFVGKDGAPLDRAGVRRQAALFALELLLPSSDGFDGEPA